MYMLQSIAWQVTIVCVALLLLIFGFVAMNAGARSEGAGDAVTRMRGRVFWILVAVFIPIIGYSLSRLPYFPPQPRAADPLVVKAVGHQWRWEIDPVTVPSGRPVEFHVSSADVNHGFAIYDPELKIVAQTQGMPGYTNVLHVKFDRAGTYRVLCLEYCGLAHHKMMTEITVTETR
jgi:cytochrome c oxidase subunit 2